MGVTKYVSRGKTFWRVDVWLKLPDGRFKRFRQKRIPTQEQARALEAEKTSEAFNGRFFDKRKTKDLTVKQLWNLYQPASKEKKSWQSDVGRAKHLLNHLGDLVAISLNESDIVTYRGVRREEFTRRGGPPSPATLDLELALLKRMCSYAVGCEKLGASPVVRVPLLREPNTRDVTIDEAGLARLVSAADPAYRPILIVAYDQGMRESEILNLRWKQVDLKAGTFELPSNSTKTKKARTVYLTSRVIEAINDLPRRLGSEYVFASQRTGSKWAELRRKFNLARTAIGREDLWFHDLRRSFVTNARRRGVAESVVMKLSGHRTRAVFDRYNIVSDEDVRNAVRTIEAGMHRDLESAV